MANNERRVGEAPYNLPTYNDLVELKKDSYTADEVIDLLYNIDRFVSNWAIKQTDHIDGVRHRISKWALFGAIFTFAGVFAEINFFFELTISGGWMLFPPIIFGSVFWCFWDKTDQVGKYFKPLQQYGGNALYPIIEDWKSSIGEDKKNNA